MVVLSALTVSAPSHARDLQHAPDADVAHGEEHERQPMIFEHVPLMQGLKIIDRQDGGLTEVAVYQVIVEASGSINADDIYEYYEYNLPKLGWDSVSSHRGTFRNSAEELFIIPQPRGDVLTATFKLNR
jgi:hypothetical protein